MTKPDEFARLIAERDRWRCRAQAADEVTLRLGRRVAELEEWIAALRRLGGETLAVMIQDERNEGRMMHEPNIRPRKARKAKP